MIAVTEGELALFSSIVALVVIGLAAFFFFSRWLEKEKSAAASPYTKKPLRRATDLHYLTREKVYEFLYKRYEFHNPIFELKYAAFCRETGRIFPDCVNFFDNVKVDWTFLKKRYPGEWISWGSLTTDQKFLFEDKHGSLEGFQVDYSCPNPSPPKIYDPYIHTQPGPLYVDLKTYNVMGWQQVPDTEVEVLIVQKPKRRKIQDVEPLENE